MKRRGDFVNRVFIQYIWLTLSTNSDFLWIVGLHRSQTRSQTPESLRKHLQKFENLTLSIVFISCILRFHALPLLSIEGLKHNSDGRIIQIAKSSRLERIKDNLRSGLWNKVTFSFTKVSKNLFGSSLNDCEESN